MRNAQREAHVDMRRLGRLAQCAVKRLRIRSRGTLAITFIGTKRMQALNRQFLRHDRPTDVLSFRYDDEPVVGEILISPRMAKRYATEHRLAYEDELARYVMHGLLHWLGHEDATPAEQRLMRQREDRLLHACH
jgi:probable rRNA maturation factor